MVCLSHIHFLTVVCGSCSSQRIQQEEDMTRMALFAGCNPSFRNSLRVLLIFYLHSCLTFHISGSHFAHLFPPLLWEISTVSLLDGKFFWERFGNTLGTFFWGKFFLATLGPHLRELQSFLSFFIVQTVSFHSPTHRGTHINTFMKLRYFYTFSRKMIFKSLPLIF